jgi:AcrR family transcriptional regulator
MTGHSTRSQQSREWIILSLLQLMDNQVYSDISITDIARKAGLARQTFYRNYQDKDDILFDFLRHQFSHFRELWDEQDIFSEAMFVSLFRTWKEQMPPSLVGNICNYDRKIRQIIFRSLDHFIQELFKEHTTTEQERQRSDLYYYAQRSLSSTLHVLLIEWTLLRFEQSPEEMGRLTYQLTCSMRELVR